MKYIKRITFITWFMLGVMIFGKILHIVLPLGVHTSSKILWWVCLIVSLYYTYHDLRYNITIYKVYGVATKDKTFDVTRDSFVHYTGHEPFESDSSKYYKDLYSIYEIPITKRMIKLCKNHNFLKVTTNSIELLSWSKRKEKAVILKGD